MALEGGGDPPEQTGAIERTLRALQAVAEQGEFTPKDIAREVGLPTSTAYRLIQSLGAMNFVEKSSHGSYRVGRQLLRLASLIVDKFDYEALARPFLERLVEQFDETAAFALYLPNEHCFTIVDSVTPRHPLQYVVQKFARRPMIGGALGRSMLPFLPEEDVLIALERQEITGSGPLDRADLAAEFESIHRLGCFVATGPNTLGTNGTAAPVFNSRGQLLGSLGVTVPVVRYDPSIQDELNAAVIDAARGLSAAMGFGAKLPGRRKAAA